MCIVSETLKHEVSLEHIRFSLRGALQNQHNQTTWLRKQQELPNENGCLKPWSALLLLPRLLCVARPLTLGPGPLPAALQPSLPAGRCPKGGDRALGRA